MSSQLGDHGVVVGAHCVTRGHPGIDAHSCRPVQPVDRAAGWQETGGHVLGVEACLHRVTLQLHLMLSQRQRSPFGDGELPGHQILTGDRLGYRVFNLEASVHLHEIEGAFAEQELYGASPSIVDGHGGSHCRFAHGAAQGGGDIRCRRLFNYLLMTALQ